ncbi:MAG: FtsX-like permease family protein [Gemmatimonas sp.]|nr:FtsX-like permease family protein [Gemmatimonas sp.]
MSVVAGTLSVLLLSAAGLYAMMSLAVTQRQREIGIRTALGGARWQVLRSVFSRVLTQLAVGIVAGGALAVWLDFASGGLFTDGAPRVLLVVVVMVTVGLLAALGPARRSLRIQPMDALREG